LITNVFGVFVAVEKISRIENAIPEVLVCEAVKSIRAAACEDIHLRASVSTVLGAVAVDCDLELLDRVYGRLEDIAIDERIIIVDAIEQVVVELLARAIRVKRNGSSGGEFGILDGRRNTGSKQSKL
jgi:hypothetical protein